LYYLLYSHSGGKTSGVVLRLLTILMITGLTVIVMGVAGMTGCGGGDPRLARAQELEDSGNVEAANTLYRWILRERPDDVDVLRSLAVNLTMAQRFDEVLPYLLRTVRWDDQDARARVVTLLTLRQTLIPVQRPALRLMIIKLIGAGMTKHTPSQVNLSLVTSLRSTSANRTLTRSSVNR